MCKEHEDCEIYPELLSDYREDVIRDSMVKRWSHMFRKGRTNIYGQEANGGLL